MLVELDLTNGGRPVLCIDSDQVDDGEPLYYLSVTARRAGFKGAHISNTFIGIRPEDLPALKDCFARLEEMTTHADTDVREGLW